MRGNPCPDRPLRYPEWLHQRGTTWAHLLDQRSSLVPTTLFQSSAVLVRVIVVTGIRHHDSIQMRDLVWLVLSCLTVVWRVTKKGLDGFK